MKTYLLNALFLLCIFSQNSNAQEVKPIEKFTAHNKGKIYIYWGGNRGYYTKSDITFQGENYKFKIDDVTAHDKPKGWHIDYVNPARMTIPQTNFRIGYFVSDKYNISFGVDHMKYVMTQNQTVNMNGEINLPLNEAGSTFNGAYVNNPMVMTEDFLKFEHTDGLNYVNTEITRVDDITKIFGWNTDKVQLNTVLGGGFGLLYPKTNTTLLGKERHDDFHVSGFGTALKVGLNLTFFKYFFIQSELKGGYINMQDIRTTKSSADSASQDFNFLQTNIVFGGIFKIN
jgi:hypothetical protein